jgi:hypothetical protein
LKWWYAFLPVFNGVSMMAVKEWSYPDTVFSCDACLEGLGGMFEDQFVHAIFPPFITEQNLHINCLVNEIKVIISNINFMTNTIPYTIFE